MALSLDQLRELPATFYRVTVKALIYDENGRLLITTNDHGHDELPGGGLEFGESYEDCLTREIREELGAEVAEIADIACMYVGRNHDSGLPTVRIVVRVTLRSDEIKPSDTMVSYRYINRDEFLKSNLEFDEQGIGKCVETLFSKRSDKWPMQN